MKTLLLALLLASCATHGATILTLNWDDPNPPETQVARYIVLGKEPTAPAWINLGTSTTNSFRFENLKPGLWHFAIRAVTILGFQSELSEPSPAIRINAVPLPVGKPSAVVGYNVVPVR